MQNGERNMVRKAKTIISMMLTLCMLGVSAATAGAIDFSGGEIISGGETMKPIVDNSNLNVTVIRQRGDEKTTIFSGKLGDFNDGAFIHVDFAGINFLTVIDWDSAEDEVYYIVPQKDENTSDIMGGGTTEIIQSNIANTQIGNARINVSVLYNNEFSEGVVLEGETLTAEISVKNIDEENPIDITSVLAIYDSDGKLLQMNTSSGSVEKAENDILYNSIVVPAEQNAASAKLMIWDSLSGVRPYISPIIMTSAGRDFFGDDYTMAQPISAIRNKISGTVNTAVDVDVFSFVPPQDGLYYFEGNSQMGTSAQMYRAGNMDLPMTPENNNANSDNFRLMMKLKTGTTYYLYVTGNEIGDYSVNYGYFIGNIFGTVGPVKYYSDDMEFNRDAEATVNLQNYETGECVATVHLKENSRGVNNAPFTITGIHAGEYLVKTARPGYLAKYQRINLNDNVVDLGSVSLIPGDANGDDVIDNNDLILVNSLLGKEYGDEEYVIGADVNADKIIDSADAAIVTANIGKTSNNYDDNVNVIIMRAELVDNQIMISGKAAANSALQCRVYYDNYSIFEEEVTCSADGSFEIPAELNRNGDYTVEVTCDNRAYKAEKNITY